MKVQQTVTSVKYEKSKNRIKWNKKKILENGAFSGINDFVISFEPLCYFSKLVKRVSKLFIPRAWIGHIAWGHGNTLVGRILVCINLHTFSLPNIGTNRPKTNKLCQKYVVFVFLNVQVRIWKKWTKIMENSQKRARDWRKVKSRSRGRNLSKKSPKWQK